MHLFNELQTIFSNYACIFSEAQVFVENEFSGLPIGYLRCCEVFEQVAVVALGKGWGGGIRVGETLKRSWWRDMLQTQCLTVVHIDRVLLVKWGDRDCSWADR